MEKQLDGWVQIDLDTGDSGNGEENDGAYISTRDNNVDVQYALTEAIKFSPMEETANQQASLRSKIVNYALKFVGNPYVWGGTNLNTGADCSGFVKSVYKSFGYNLPRSSSSQRSAGRKVSYSNKQPGDLICYSGHIAIYIGSGKIVHASSRKTGIKISPKANYRKVLSVRRIVK